jgi:hypothetical protein
MIINNFIRFAEVLKLKGEKRIVSVTIRPLIADSTGEIYFTDLQLQEGAKLTGYTPHTTTMLRDSGNASRYQNAVVRGGATLVLFNTGETSAGLDCYIYPKQAMAAGSIEVSQGMGSHKCKFTSAVNAGDEFVLKAVARESLRNGNPTPKDGFYQYSAAYDSKHLVKLESGKSARVYLEYTEMMEGEPRP